MKEGIPVIAPSDERPTSYQYDRYVYLAATWEKSIATIKIGIL